MTNIRDQTRRWRAIGSGISGVIFPLTTLASLACGLLPAVKACAEVLKPIEQLKEFIANPPAIESLTFSYKGPPRYRADRVRGVVTEAAPVLHYLASWTRDSLLSMESPTAEWPPGDVFTKAFDLGQSRAVVRNGEEYWLFENPAGKVTTWSGVFPSAPDRENPVHLGYMADTMPLHALLSLGAHFIPPSTIRWKGNAFEQVTRTWDGLFTIRGELKEDRQGRAESMQLRYASHTANGRFEVRYSYETNSAVPAFLPTRMTSVVFHDEKEAPDKDIRVRSLTMGDSAVVRARTRPDVWLKNDQLARFEYVSNGLYSVLPDGQKQLIPKERSLPGARAPMPLAHVHRYYYVGCGLLSGGFLILCLRMRRLGSVETQHQ